MRIDHQGTRGVEQTGGAPDRPGARPAGPTGPGAPSSSHAPSAELEALLGAVAQFPAVRSAVVADVARRLRAGEVLTPAAVVRAAEALLGPGPDALVPSPELLAWAAAVQQLPQARPDVVAEASRKVADGELSTPAAIRRTAHVLLG